jgi:hypothetical protein
MKSGVQIDFSLIVIATSFPLMSIPATTANALKPSFSCQQAKAFLQT